MFNGNRRIHDRIPINFTTYILFIISSTFVLHIYAMECHLKIKISHYPHCY